MSRCTRTLLLTATNLLYPKVPKSVTEKLNLKRQKGKWYHDRYCSLPEIELEIEIEKEREIAQVIRVARMQTPFPELEEQMSTLSPLPAAKKTSTQVAKPLSRFKDFVA